MIMNGRDMAIWGVVRLVFTLYVIISPSRFEENVSENKTVATSSRQDPDKWPPEAAVDGNVQNNDVDFCAHTRVKHATKAWWRVDLGHKTTIINITIYYRVQFEHRFAGYQIYVSNSTKRSRAKLCFKDTSTSLEEVKNIISHQCQYVARYVMIYNFRNEEKDHSWYSKSAVLELCEVQVFGCPIGKYGKGNCEQSCSDDCYGGNCNAVTGTCFDCYQECSAYCTISKDSGTCTDCLQGVYGDRCNQICSDNCENKQCDKDSGNCADCIPRKYGKFCSEDCSRNCNDTMCYRDNGFCKSCVPGKYGDVCEHDCSNNCKDKTCIQENGNCLACVPGKHGDVCENDCSYNCKDKTCIQENGNCVGCVRGKQGLQCTKNCSINCTECKQDDGICTECVPGKHGIICELECSENCHNAICYKTTGLCRDCKDGHFGFNCTRRCRANCKICNRQDGNCTECVKGSYGGNCSQPCVNCEVCAKETGECLTACISGFEGKFCQTSSKDGTGVAVGVVVGLGVVAIVIILIIIWRYKLRSTKEDSIDDPRGQELSQYRTSPRDNDENVTEPLTDSENVYINVVDPGVIGQVDCNVNPVGIAINDLKSVVNTKMLNQAKAFEDEYKSLPSGDLHEHKFAVLTENKHKNRYKAIFPYDHSRVILDSQGKDSDYINASYIDSVTQPAEYIATQGPTYKTIDDFWRMIWQLKSGKIVMLTNLEEGTKKKCEKYWPDEGEQMSTVHFSITLKKETGYAFYVIRDITVTERETKSVRQIHQFHYTTWPDHGTPNPKELVVFHRRVRNYKTSLNGKMVFHCSAGIGRTGTFIALDALFHYGREFGIIDVMEYIVTMRKDRINMVQTSDQYIALHHILIEAFDMPDTLISRIKYHTSLDNLSGNGPRNQAKLWQEYQLLQTTRPVYTQEDYQTALLAVNNDKNVDPNILPVDKFRVYLMSYVSGRTDYINAVAVPSYTSGSGFIITQIPLEDTVIDLLTMLMDNQCDTIVIIGRDSLKWLPKEGIDETIGSFVLKHAEGASNLHNVDVLDIGVTNHSNHYDANVRIFCMTGWEGDIPLLSDSSTLLQLLERIDSRRKSNDTMRTVVMCRDGYTKSGLFCCIGNARDQMKMDDEVDIYQVSQQLIVRRPQYITNFEQYQYCYNVINDYLDNTDLYIN